MILFGNAPIDSPKIDAFNRNRVSEPITIFDSKQLFDKQALFWNEELGGNATSVHSAVDASTTMSVTASASDYVIRQTKSWFNYQPGKGQLIFFTFLMNQESGITKRVGYFNGTGTNNLTPNNGIFLETSGTGQTNLSWNIAKNGTTTETYNQTQWNVDKLDGAGPSKITLDFEAPQIGIIDFEWLGTGRVRVGFVINGVIVYCHYFNHANDSTFDSVYMSTPNLPMRYSIQSDGSNSGSLDHICSTVISEGGIEPTGTLRAFDMGTTPVNCLLNTTNALIGVRKKSTHLGITVDPKDISMISVSKEAFRWALHINPTISNTFTFNDVDDSALQVAYGNANNTITGDGIVIGSGYASGSILTIEKELEAILKIGSTITGTSDILVLSVLPIATSDMLASITIRESL